MESPLRIRKPFKNCRTVLSDRYYMKTDSQVPPTYETLKTDTLCGQPDVNNPM